ncbi:tetratricopeptide repeat protein [bacterium]|nr:tetratricopeptide repeat protein [bacterium]
MGRLILITLLIVNLFSECIIAKDTLIQAPVLTDSVVSSFQDFNEMENFFKAFSEYQEYTMQKHIELPESYPQSAMNWAANEGNGKFYARAKYYYFTCLANNLNFSEAILTGNQLISDEEFQRDTLCLHTLLFLNDLYLKTLQYGEIIELYPLYSQLYKQSSEVTLRPRLLYDHDMGLVYFRLRNYAKAIEYFRNPNISLEASHSTLAQSSALNNIGLSFKELGNWDSAKYYFAKAIEKLKTGTLKEQHISGYGQYFSKVIESNMAEYYFVTSQYDEALPIFLEELSLSKIYGENHITAGAALKVARVKYLLKDFQTSINYLDTCLDAAQTINRLDYQIKAYKLMGMCYSFLDDMEKSTQFFAKETILRDSVERERIRQDYNLSSIKYETTKMNENLRASLHKVELAKSKSKLQNFGMITAFLSAITFFIFYLNIRRNKLIISAQKESIQSALSQKEVLLREVHHRVKNNLQVISSMLQLQVRKINDTKYEHMVKEAKEQIASMAMVHEMLYENSDVSAIQLTNYLKDLALHVAQSRNNNKVDIKIDSKDIVINIEKAIPLGLITTELIINSYKHAFKNEKAGVINIKVKEIEHFIEFRYEDNGASEEEIEEYDQSGGLGIKLVKMLSEEINAEQQTLSYFPFKFQLLIPNK